MGTLGRAPFSRGTMDLIQELETLEREARDAVPGVRDADELEALRVRLLGRKEGRLTAILRQLAQLPPEEKPRIGAAANRTKDVVSGLLEARAAELERAAGAGAGGTDLTMPGRAGWRGARHPVTLVVDEIVRVFRSLGFTVTRGP